MSRKQLCQALLIYAWPLLSVWLRNKHRTLPLQTDEVHSRSPKGVLFSKEKVQTSPGYEYFTNIKSVHQKVTVEPIKFLKNIK